MIRKYILLIGILLSFSVALHGQEFRDTMTVYFQKESALFNSKYKDNGARLDEFSERVNSYLQSQAKVSLHIESVASSSPEGAVPFNTIMAEARGSSAKHHLLKRVNLPADSISITFIPEDWNGLIKAIEADPRVTHKSRILSVLNSREENNLNEEQTLQELLKIGYSRPYWYIYHNIFPLLRSCRITAIVDMSGLFVDQTEDDFEELSLDSFIPIAADCDSIPPMHVIKINGHNIAVSDSTDLEALNEKFESRVKLSKWDGTYSHNVKVNAVGYLMGAANVAYEYSFSERLSLNVPFYYSGVNYFRPDLKLRLCTIQPELRYHFAKAEGLFAGVHAGLGWFNLALMGDYRIQSRGGSRPAFGGGLGVGYRASFKYMPRLGIEVSMGAGIYDVRYDRFYNVPNGAYAARDVHKTFIGIDNVSVSLVYSFNFKKED